jgi:mannose-6-phosphate isomerase-like protein (cupin superfamily)
MSSVPVIESFVEVGNGVDARRRITEVVLPLTDGSCCRVSKIEVASSAEGSVRLGDHYHPGDESFVVLTGSAQLYTAPADDLTSVTCQGISAGQAVNIPPRVAHVFVCTPGTRLHSIANTPFSESWIIPARLDLSLA